MQNKLLAFIRQYDMIAPGDRIICAVSGGADSVALLFAMYLLKEKLDITLEAAHFNHNLRGEESRRDEDFVRALCGRYDIPLHVGSGEVRPGKKGLEAAAREARYGFLKSLGGKIATAHTADDNGETVLMHMVRGTGLKGLGAIAPVNGNVIRPMLLVTRREVEEFLEEWGLSWIQDSSNDTDAFLRNRIRHCVMPLLKAENPRLAESLSRMALGLREDEKYLSSQAAFQELPSVEELKDMPKAIRSRCLERFLKESGVKEPEDAHIQLAEGLVYSQNPSARGNFPGGVTIVRHYDRLKVLSGEAEWEGQTLPCPGQVEIPGLRIICREAEQIRNTPDAFTVQPEGAIVVRPRLPGDVIRLPGGSKSLKKLFIDRKIPAPVRNRIPVVCDDRGILGVYSIGVHKDRAADSLPAVTIYFEKTDSK